MANQTKTSNFTTHARGRMNSPVACDQAAQSGPRVAQAAEMRRLQARASGVAAIARAIPSAAGAKFLLTPGKSARRECGRQGNKGWQTMGMRK